MRNYHYLHAGHLGASRVCSVGGHWDEANLPVALVIGFQICHDSSQARVLAL
jgi:hypothetical protein